MVQDECCRRSWGDFDGLVGRWCRTSAVVDPAPILVDWWPVLIPGFRFCLGCLPV